MIRKTILFYHFQVDRETLVGETINFIRALEQTKAQLEKQKQEQALARQGMVGLQTWSTPNIVLSIVNDKAIINVRAPRKPCMLSLVLSVLNKHGIDVVSAQVSADSVGSFFTIYTHVSSMFDLDHPSSFVHGCGLLLPRVVLGCICTCKQQLMWVLE